MRVLKISLPQKRGIADYRIVKSIFKILRKNKKENRFAVLFPELKTGKKRTFGKYMLVYANNAKFFDKIIPYLNKLNLYFEIPTIEKDGIKSYAATVRTSFFSKATKSYIKNVLKLKEQGNIIQGYFANIIVSLYSKDKSIEDIEKYLKDKFVYPKYPYIKTKKEIIEFKTIFAPESFQDSDICWGCFNDYGILKSKFLGEAYLPIPRD